MELEQYHTIELAVAEGFSVFKLDVVIILLHHRFTDRDEEE